MALFFFLLTKYAPSSLTTAHFVALYLPFSCRRAQFAQNFLLKPVQFCNLYAGLDITNKTTIFSFFLYQTFALTLLHFSPLRLYTFGTSGRNYPTSPPTFQSGSNGYWVIHFFRAITRLMIRPDEMRCLSHLHYRLFFYSLGMQSHLHLFSDWGALSHQNSLIQVLQHLLKNLCFLIEFAMSPFALAVRFAVSFYSLVSERN